MAGSIKWFVYTTDDGTDFAINKDESNTEFINGGTQDYPNTGTIIYALPKNVTPRQLVFRSVDGTVTRKIVALTQTIYDAVLPASTFTDPVSGKVTYLTRKEGELVRVPIGPDTGLDDGDAT